MDHDEDPLGKTTVEELVEPHDAGGPLLDTLAGGSVLYAALNILIEYAGE
ncbi:MAG: hypothetical protein WCF90_09910 [Methanomicrobiales archaeon]